MNRHNMRTQSYAHTLTQVWRTARRVTGIAPLKDLTCQGSTRTAQNWGLLLETSADTGWHSCPWCPYRPAAPRCDASSLADGRERGGVTEEAGRLSSHSPGRGGNQGICDGGGIPSLTLLPRSKSTSLLHSSAARPLKTNGVVGRV